MQGRLQNVRAEERSPALVRPELRTRRGGQVSGTPHPARSSFHTKRLLSVSSSAGDQRLHVGLLCFSGVGIGVVHAGYERRLARHLGAHSTPSILGVINGKVSFFHNAVVPENLRQFIENLLPGNLVEKVSTCLRSSRRGAWDSLLAARAPPVELGRGKQRAG